MNIKKTTRCQSLLVGLLVMVTALSAPVIASGKNKGCSSRISGRITRTSDNPPGSIFDNQVYLVNRKYKVVAKAKIDRDGYYTFNNLCPGSSTVHPDIFYLAEKRWLARTGYYIGIISMYEPDSRTVEVPARMGSDQAANITGVDFRMDPSRLPALGNGQIIKFITIGGVRKRPR